MGCGGAATASARGSSRAPYHRTAPREYFTLQSLARTGKQIRRLNDTKDAIGMRHGDMKCLPRLQRGGGYYDGNLQYAWQRVGPLLRCVLSLPYGSHPARQGPVLQCEE